MTSFGTKSILTELHHRNACAVSGFKDISEALNTEQWNWKPAPKSWSIAQVVDHLVITNDYYIAPMLQGIESAPKITKQTFKSSWLGNMIVMRLEPTSPKRNKPVTAPAFLQPQTSDLNGKEISHRFLEQLNQLELIITRAGAVDFSSIKIPLSFTKLLKLNIGDVLRLIIAHNDRHLLQMQRLKDQVTNTPT